MGKVKDLMGDRIATVSINAKDYYEMLEEIDTLNTRINYLEWKISELKEKAKVASGT